MNNKVAILTPTYKRPHRVIPYIQNIQSVTNMNDVEIVFIVEHDDYETINVCEEVNAKYIINQRSRSYAGAMNTAIRELDNEYFFLAADDCLFHNNWLPPILELSKEFAVVGTNDLGNPAVLEKIHATHYLVCRRYLSKCVADSPEDILNEQYIHNFTDTELIQTAIYNNEFAPCLESIVEHLHPVFGKASVDETYLMKHNTGFIDEQLFISRKHLWEKQ